MFSITQRGNFNKTDKFLSKAQRLSFFDILNRYGEEGVQLLANATPKDTGFTADSWYYVIFGESNSFGISWRNSNIVDGFPIVILLQYGHGTRHGGYVEGRDFINPAIKPVFDKLALEIWEEVKGL